MNEEYKIEILRFSQVICDHYKINMEDLQSERRFRKLVHPRQLIWAIARDIYGARITFEEMGALLGGKDHATVIHGCKTIANLLDTDAAFRMQYNGFLRMAKIKVYKEPPQTIKAKLSEILTYTDIINMRIAMRELITAINPRSTLLNY